MKLAIVTPGGVDESGTERVIPAFLWLIERLARRHDVHVFALSQEPRPRDWPLLGATVHNVGTVGARRLRFHRLFAREHRVAPFDLVHALFGGSALHALSAATWFRLHFANCIAHPTTMFRRSTYDAVGGYDASVVPAEDHDLWLRMARVGEAVSVPEPLLRYRRGPTSLSSSGVRTSA